MQRETLLLTTAAATADAALLAGCATTPPGRTAAELDAPAMAMTTASLRALGIAKLDRIAQDHPWGKLWNSKACVAC